MEIIPTIDLRAGAVVRLFQGDYDRQTTFGNDPVGVAKQFEADGASRIHVVDLDGAKEGRRTQAAQVRAIAAAVAIPIELGGGLRSLADIDSAIEDGAGRVILGTVAVQDPGLVRDAIARHGEERVVVGIDARDGMVAVSGWTQGSAATAADLLDAMTAAGVRRFIYTDIARDGALTSPNFEAVAGMVRRAEQADPAARLIASGGVAGIDHLRTLASLGVEGAIVGSAIYQGVLDLPAAIAELNSPPPPLRGRWPL